MSIILKDINFIFINLKKPINFILFFISFPFLFKIKILWLFFIFLIIFKTLIGFFVYNVDVKPERVLNNLKLFHIINNLSTEISKFNIYIFYNYKKLPFVLFIRNSAVIIIFRFFFIFLIGINIKFLKIWIGFIDIFLTRIIILKLKSPRTILMNIFKIAKDSLIYAIRNEYMFFFKNF